MLLDVKMSSPRFNEAAVFGLALLGGMLGIPLLRPKRAEATTEKAGGPGAS
jgi:hypothetical protein